MDALLFLIETRKPFAVSTFSRHSWQSNAQTVGSGLEIVGSGVGFSNAPEKVRTGCETLKAVPCATGLGAGAIESAPLGSWSHTERTRPQIAIADARLRRMGSFRVRCSGLDYPRAAGSNRSRSARGERSAREEMRPHHRKILQADVPTGS